MMRQYRFALTAPEAGQRISGYRLYGWLLEQLPAAFGEAFHQSEAHPLTQYLTTEAGRQIWVLNLLTRELNEALAPEGWTEAALDGGAVGLTLLDSVCIPGPEALIADARGEAAQGSRVRFDFHSVTSFRQEGRYVIFPQEQLLVNSLIRRWNLVCPGFPLEDEDAVRALAAGLRISDYRLRTGRYWLKEVKIPGFVGSVTLSARLSPPMLELWRLLCRFAPYAGVGIKTSLGMGGVSVCEEAGRASHLFFRQNGAE